MGSTMPYEEIDRVGDIKVGGIIKWVDDKWQIECLTRRNTKLRGSLNLSGQWTSGGVDLTLRRRHPDDEKRT